MSEPIITLRRGNRSPMTPPSASIDTCASVHAANERPTAVALPPRSRTANATAMGARYVPTYEIARPVKRSLKLRSSIAIGPAPETFIRLPERHCKVVLARVLSGVAELELHVLDEFLELHASADGVGPVVELEPQVGEVALDVVGDAPVDQGEPLGIPALELLQRLLPRVEVELGRRSRRHDEPARLDADTRGVARVERAVAVEVADVVRGVAGRGEAVESEHPLTDDVHVVLGHGCQLAPERVERIAVQSSCASLEA